MPPRCFGKVLVRPTDPQVIARFMRWVHLAKCTRTGCWLWGGKADKDGYGQFRQRGVDITLASGRKGVVAAHRMAYAIFYGGVPEGLDVHHTCRRRLCVNPDHLEIVDHVEHGVESGGYVASGAESRIPFGKDLSGARDSYPSEVPF